jgi:hypothetical protein
VRSEGLGKVIRFIPVIGSRTRDLSACSLVPQTLRYPVPHKDTNRDIIPASGYPIETIENVGSLRLPVPRVTCLHRYRSLQQTQYVAGMIVYI